MPHGREREKKFYVVRPYGDLSDQTFVSPPKASLKVLPGRGGYYDNPSYIMSPTMHQYRHEEDHSSNTSNSRLRSHKSRSKRHCIGATAIFLLVLLIIIAIGISVYFLNEQMVDNGTMPSRPPPSKLDSESLTADPDFEATIRVTNYDWDTRMADNESDVFRQTASDMEKQLDNIFSKGPIAPLYNYSVVHSFSQGSIVIDFTVHLKKIKSDATDEEKKQLEEQKLTLKKTPDIVVQAIKEGIEEINKEQEQAGVTSSLLVLDIDTNNIEVEAITTTTTPQTTSTTTPTTTAATTTPTSTADTTETASMTDSTSTATTTTPTSTVDSSETATTTDSTTPATTTATNTVTTTTPTSTTDSTETATTTTPTSTMDSTANATTTATTTTPITDLTTTATTKTSTTTDTTTTPTSTTDSTTEAKTTASSNPLSSAANLTTILTTPKSTTPSVNSTATTSSPLTADPSTSPRSSIFLNTTSTTNTPSNSSIVTITSTNIQTTSPYTTSRTASTTEATVPVPKCPELESWKEKIIMTCNSSIQAANEASVHEDQCYHYSQVVKCSTWLAQVMKYNCSMQDMRLMYNKTMDWISVTTYDCLGIDMDIIQPFPASTACDDLNAFKYIIYYDCNGNDIGYDPCSTLFDAPECITRNLNSLQLNCNQEKVTMLLNRHRDVVFNRSTIKACEDKMAPLINGSCYGISKREYFNEVPPCFKTLRELKDETTSLNTTCRMYLEGTRCLERKANNLETCSASRISSILNGQMKYVMSQGENGISTVLFIYGSAEKMRRVVKCQENMESVENVAKICDDEEFIADTIFSDLCVYQTMQDQNQCSATQSDLLQCTIRTVQDLDSNCPDTTIEHAVMSKINDTNSNFTVCDNEEYCSNVLVKNDDILVCLRFLSFLNYTDLTVDDTCQFFGEGLECMSYFLRYLNVFCQPGTLTVSTAKFLIDNRYSKFDFSVCEDNMTLEVIPSTRPLCDNEEALLKYTMNACIQPVLRDIPEIPDTPCTLLPHISYCVTKTLYESVIYCTPGDVATVLIDNAQFVQAKYPSLNFTGCSVPDFNISVDTTTPSIMVNRTCKWDDILESLPQDCANELMDMNRTHGNECETLYKLYDCIQSSIEPRGMYCPIAVIDKLFKYHGDEVMPHIGFNPRSCSDVVPINKTCSGLNQLVVDPNAPEYVLKCFSLVFVSLSDDISYDHACRLLAMAMTCAMKKSTMLGYDCTTDTIGPAVYSYTSLVFKTFNFDPDNCTAPIETRSMCVAGDLMAIIASSSPCFYYASLNNEPTCQSLSMLVECVSMRISTSGMFCSKSIIHEYLVDNIDMFELNTTFNFTSCIDKDVIEIPSTNLSSCSVVPVADGSPLDICQASIKEFHEAVNDSAKCRILFDVMRCVASSSFYMGYNCSIDDIIRLYGSSVLQGFNPENCDTPSEDDVPRGGNICTDVAVFEYFINYDCKRYIPDEHHLGFCGSLMRMSNCLGEILIECPKYEINTMIQAQPFMMYIGSIDDCKHETTTTPSPHYMSTTPYYRKNTTICVWENILDTASTICHDQMLELAHNNSEKCPKLTSVAQCIHIAMVARDIECPMSTFLQLTYQNADYMMKTFNVEVQDCLDENKLLYPPLYVVDRGSLCSSPVVYDFVSEDMCINTTIDCNLQQYMGCLANNVLRLTNDICSIENFSPNLAVDTFLQTYVSKCSNVSTDLLSNQCINPLSSSDLTSISPCITPLILMDNRTSCSLYAHSLKCMSTKLGVNCTIQMLHQYIQTAFSLIGQVSGNMNQMSVIPRVAEICNKFVSNLTVETIPDSCQDSNEIVNLIKLFPCIPQSVDITTTPCLYLVPSIRQCIQLASNMTGCKAEDIVQIVTTNTVQLNDFIPIVLLEKCLGNGTFEENCPIILPNEQNTNIRSCLTHSITARVTPNTVHEDACRLDSVAVKCVKEKGRLVGYDCKTESVLQLINSVPIYLNQSSPPCTIDEIQGSICDQSDVMGIFASGFRCSMAYYNLQSESTCSLLDKMTDCVSQRLLESGMFCDKIKIKEGLISQTERLQGYFNQIKQSSNVSSCVLASEELSYDAENMTECSEMLATGFDPVDMCQHSLSGLNQTQDTDEQCRVFGDSMTCLVFASQFSGFNCTAEDIKDMYINNNTMLSTVYDTLSQSCSGQMKVPRLTSSSACNVPFLYNYIIQYICSQFIPGNSDRMPCSAIQDLGSCINSTLSTEFQVTCPSYLIEGHLQRQPFMTYFGSISSCSDPSNVNLPRGCDEVSVNSWYFTECDQQYTMINQEPERACLHWEITLHCVQANVYNDGKYRYCKTKDVLDSLVNGIELGNILPNFDPESCTQENLPDDPCDERMLYGLAMNKCDPKNKICGQEASIKQCVIYELNSHGKGCEDKLDEKLQDLISQDNRDCTEGQYSIDSRNQVYIYQNMTKFICGLYWNDTDAEVLCNQLGFSFGIAKTDNEYHEYSGFTYNCTGNESRLEDCPKHYDRDCFFKNIVAKAFCYNDDIEYGLIDGQSANAGRVTVIRNGVKGYLCSGYYSSVVTNSVCRKLGFVGGDNLHESQLLTKSLDKTWRNTISCPFSGIDFAGCAQNPWDVNPLPENEYNMCYRNMAVYCHKKTRLNTANNNNTGMLMMYVENNDQPPRLTPVCKDNINQDIVTAQCQNLGFNDGGELLDVNPFVSEYAYFGVKINTCPSTANTIEDCDLEYDRRCTTGPAILHCFINQTVHRDGDIKIDSTGRIWVYKYDLWGTICSEGWNNKAARSVCRSQGYDSGVSRKLSGLNYMAIDTKWLYNVTCFGNETGLLNCTYSTSDDANVCRNADDAGAYCFNQSDNPDFTLRDGVPPTPGSLPNYGRLYFIVNGEEGALCAPRGVHLPRVICKQQGFDYGEYYEGGLPSPRTSVSWRGDLQCKYSDSMVLMCFEDEVKWIRVDSTSPSEISCDGHNTIQVFCYSQAWLNTGFFNKTGMITMSKETEQPIVLCENQINKEGLNVFCKSTKMSNTSQKIESMQYPGYHDTGIKGYNCTGGELYLSRCQINNVQCEGRPVIVRCDDNYDDGTIEDLVMDNDSGRLKLLKYSVFGSMCADQWTDVEADVFCKSKGYNRGYAKILSANRRVAQFHAFKCNGSEKSLLECKHLSSPSDTCNDAAVKCLTETDDLTLSLEHQNEYEGYGRILVSKSGLTSYFCDTGYLSSADAANICRHLGFAESSVLDVERPIVGLQTSAWEVDFDCNSYNLSLYGCINGNWKYETWTATEINPSRCRYELPQIRCSKPINSKQLPDLKSRCENETIYKMVDMDCGDVISNITEEVKTSQMSACQFVPELVRCLAENLIAKNIYCTEGQVFSALRQNKPEITSIIGGLNTDNCDGMTFTPNSDCSSLPLVFQLLPQCFDIPNTTITDPAQIVQLCSQGGQLFECLVQKTRQVGYLCKSDDFMNLMAQNQQLMTQKLRFDISICIQNPPQQTTQKTVMSTVSSDVHFRCLNSSIYDMVDKDCDDVIDNITMEVQTSQRSACQYFPELVRCLSEKLISRNIICSETQVFTRLRDNEEEITSIIGGLNTDYCDGMTFVPKDGCTSLPLYTNILPQCYDAPITMVTDTDQVAQLCSKGYEMGQCLLKNIVDLGYTGCNVDRILGTFVQNPQWAQNELKFDISQCQQPKN